MHWSVLTFRIKESVYIDTTFRKDSYEAMKASCGLIHVTMELQSSVSGYVSYLQNIAPDDGDKHIIASTWCKNLKFYVILTNYSFYLKLYFFK
jgi:hypothetical protein